MDNSNIVIIGIALGQLLTFLTLIFNARDARLREERKRAWEIEDRRLVAQKTVEVSRELARTVTAQHCEQLSAIKDNTAKTEEGVVAAHSAYKEANDVNVKIAHLNKRLLENESHDSR